mmetsp:Transcript_44701/g.87669  ORF Transcript_44701/g.87669 Transcript_44701/m.87669 type:complete len:230 (-) Transcript_44701:106-795(-)
MKLRFAPVALALLRTPPLIAASSVFEKIAAIAQNAGTASSQPGILAHGYTGGSLSKLCLTNMIAMLVLSEHEQMSEDYIASCAEEANIVINNFDNETLTNSTVDFHDFGLCDRSIVEAVCESLDYDMANFGYRYEIESVYSPDTIFTTKSRLINHHEADCLPKGCPQMEDWSVEDYYQLAEAGCGGCPLPPSFEISVKRFEGPKDTGDTAKSAKSTKCKGAKKAKSSKR